MFQCITYAKKKKVSVPEKILTAGGTQALSFCKPFYFSTKESFL